MRQLILLIINFYKKIISPIFPKSCRYYPSCSIYSKKAFIKYGIIKGTLLSIGRIIRCNPLSKGGYDPLQ